MQKNFLPSRLVETGKISLFKFVWEDFVDKKRYLLF